MTLADWELAVRQYNVLGLWYATQYLKPYDWILDPSLTAQDVVQEAWEQLWERSRFEKHLFLAVIHNCAYEAVHACRPIDVTRDHYAKSFRGRGRKMPKWRPRRTAKEFPVQIFGGLLCEETRDEAVDGDRCDGSRITRLQRV